MPKIINNLPERILAEAKDCFEKYGFEEAEMDLIAGQADIAVGTIYNYFPNKTELFLATLERSWRELEEELDLLCSDSEDPVCKLKTTIEAYYRFVEQKRGLIEEFQERHHGLHSRQLDALRRLEGIISEIFVEKGIQGLEGQDIKRIAVSIQAPTFALLQKYPGEKDENIEFIFNLIDNYFQGL
ncbi:MAG: TetR/AcrR family transcriptional regulator [Halanaerobiaceae bacterium]